MPVMRPEVEVALLDQVVADPAHHHCVVSIAKFWNKDSNSKRSLLSQGTGQETRLVVEFTSSGADAFAGFLGNRAAGDIVPQRSDNVGLGFELPSQLD
jgi:hypothetical protein